MKAAVFPVVTTVDAAPKIILWVLDGIVVLLKHSCVEIRETQFVVLDLVQVTPVRKRIVHHVSVRLVPGRFYVSKPRYCGSL